MTDTPECLVTKKVLPFVSKGRFVRKGEWEWKLLDTLSDCVGVFADYSPHPSDVLWQTPGLNFIGNESRNRGKWITFINVQIYSLLP